jgi:hypothetical protein
MRTFLVTQPREPIVPTLLGPAGLHVEFWQVLPLYVTEPEDHRRWVAAEGRFISGSLQLICILSGRRHPATGVH